MKKGLGRGLDSLFGVYAEENEVETKVEKGGEPQEIDIGLIDRNPDQPRKNFDEKALKELSDSIKSYGVVQPIIVQKNGDRFTIVAGERRWRASRMAGLSTIPCIVRDYTKRELSEISIIENLQREDLNPIESARAVKNLIEEFNLTQSDVADKIGKSRPAVANTLRLLTLPDSVVELVEKNKISAGHARALLAISSNAKQREVALEIIEKGLSVRETENLIKQMNEPQAKVNQKRAIISPELKRFEDNMKMKFATKCEIKGNEHKGKIVIEYFTKDDLNRIFDIITKK